jgi:glycosyltransferase involved in cell wall biosynthesis
MADTSRAQAEGEQPMAEREPHHEPSGLNVLIFNGDFPIFPGSGGLEYLNTTRLARLAGNVGLVSMVHAKEDMRKAQALSRENVQLYLWKSPAVTASLPSKAPPSAPAPPSWKKTCLRWLHRKIAAFSYWLKAWPSRPHDTVTTDFCFRNMAAPLREALTERAWQALVVVQSSSAAALDSIPGSFASALIMHDIRSVVYQRQARLAASWWERWKLQHQARRYYRFERRYTRRFDLVVALSEIDADWIRRHYRPRRVAIVPIPVDADYFAPADRLQERPHRIVFPGLMNHPPNVDAAVFFATEVLPAIRQALPDAEFFIVGKNPTPAVQALGELPGVTVTGAVPDTRPYLAEAAVVVVPLRFGSGVRHKILEAWAMQKCVVSTTLGAEGLAYQDGVHLAIADGAEALAGTITKALRDPDYRDRLRLGGRAVATALHDPERTARHYHDQLREVVREKVRQLAPLRLALDLRWMIPGVYGGLENLARSFMRQLIALDRFNRYTVLLPSCCRHDFDLRACSNFKVRCPETVATCLRGWRRALSRFVHRKLRLDHAETPEVVQLRFLRSLKAEMVYSFPGYISPDVYPLRQVLVVPDIQHEYHPEFFLDEHLEARRVTYGRAIRRADHICAISEFTRRCLIERLDVPPERITTVHLAADPVYSAEPHHDDARRLHKYALQPGGYLFFPAHTWHHKNHRAAVAALRILRDRHGLAPSLVCTGGRREAQPALEVQIAEAGLQGQVRFLGYCPHDDLPALYRQAAGLLFPSLFEGFGMPVLEAMASGCPVVCSNTSSLPEIAGDAALLAEPYDHEGLADAVARILRDGDLRAELGRRGLAQAARFSWWRHTLETIAVFARTHAQLQTV